MTTLSLVQILIRRWVVLFFALLASLSAALLYIWTTEPVYSTAAEILVSPVAADRSVPGSGVVVESLEPVRAVQTATALLDTEQIATRTAATLGPGVTPRYVRETVEVGAKGQSNIITITVRGTDPDRMAVVATAYAETAMAVRDEEVTARAGSLLDSYRNLGTGPTAAGTLSAAVAELELLVAEGDPSLTLTTVAPVPSTPVSPSPLLVVMLAEALGLLLGVTAAVGLERLSQTRAAARVALAPHSPLPPMTRRVVSVTGDPAGNGHP